jgi:glycosyltransferase involved in cell wall biosynthesis
VSNPTLAEWYGGAVVPHARNDSGEGAPHVAERISIVFVGTNRPHKGILQLRAAVAELATAGVTLTITDTPPLDALQHERWVGGTSLQQGVELVKSSDVVVIPSVGNNRFAAGQLPVKIVDAMLAARAVLVSDLAPLEWAIGAGGLSFPAGNTEAMVRQLRSLMDPGYRATLGAAARERALNTFTVAAVSESFRNACERAVAGRFRWQSRRKQ